MSMIRSQEVEEHQCCLCGGVFPNDQVVLRHRRLPHPHKCDECPRRFVTHPELLRHYMHPEGLAISATVDTTQSLYPEVEARSLSLDDNGCPSSDSDKDE